MMKIFYLIENYYYIDESGSFQKYRVSSFKFILKVGVEKSIVNAPHITDHGSAV
jgi:hypothetical protein